ncbi:DoxX family protein [Saprospiraceae bacterium]|nr:DoxX family protein [Saprospiraceae bacterium]
MTLTTIIIWVAAISVVLTGITSQIFKQNKSLWVSYLQNFCGAFFIFSGWVKAADPLGTSYKLIDYFTEFESTFSETWMSFITPIFPFFSEYSVAVSLAVIVLEIVLGIMLIMGAKNRLAAWLFFSIVVFFTFLTGFTALTGYVPEGVNFFSFGDWGVFDKNNMKVQDCGCFGDFLKLEPFTSFKKDLALLIPAFIFLFKTNDMHSIFSPKIRNIVTVASIGIFTLYGVSNFVWDIPGNDFRPFRVDVNIREQKILEEESMMNAPTNYVYTNNETGEEISLSEGEYIKQYKNFPKDKFEMKQMTEDPEIPHSKISEFSVEDINGNEVTQELLGEEGYSLMYVCYKLGYTQGEKNIMVADTSWLVDTIGTPGADNFQLVKKVDEISSHEETIDDYIFKSDYKNRFEGLVNPFSEAAQKAGVKVYAIAGGAGESVIRDFSDEIQATYPIYMADDILLKTIVRSNPGIVLLKDGKVIQKWHYKKLPSFDEVKVEFIK